MPNELRSTRTYVTFRGVMFQDTVNFNYSAELKLSPALINTYPH